MESQQNKYCIVCQEIENLKRCSNCKSVYYCSIDHQKQHWQFHKHDCALIPIQNLAYLNILEGDENGVLNLTQELWMHIFSYLPWKDIIHCQCVCRSWCLYSNQKLLWKGTLEKYYSNLIFRKISNNQNNWKEFFIRLSKIQIGGKWLMRVRGLPIVDVEVIVNQVIVPVTEGVNGIVDGATTESLTVAPNARGIQIGPYFAILYSVLTARVLHLSIREVHTDQQLITGPFLDVFYGVQTTAVGYVVQARLSSRKKITDDQFQLLSSKHVHSSLPFDTRAPYLEGNWIFSFKFLHGASINIKASFANLGDGVYIGNLPDVRTPTVHSLVFAIVHINGTIAIGSANAVFWPPKSLWCALCRNVGTNSDPYLEGYVSDDSEGSIRFGQFYGRLLLKEIK